MEQRRNNAHKRAGFICILVLAAVFLGFLFLTDNISLSDIYPLLKDSNDIEEIYIEISGEDVDVSLSISERTAIETICNKLKNAKLKYRGPYGVIPFGEYKNDYIVVIHLNGHSNRIYIKANGDLYSVKSKFSSKGDDIIDVFQYILEEYL